MFESNFVDVTLDNYSWLESVYSRALLFIIALGTFLLENKIFDPEKATTKIAILKLWPVYYVSDM